MAEATGIASRRIARFLDGGAEPGVNEGFRLAYALEVDVRDLVAEVRR